MKVLKIAAIVIGAAVVIGTGIGIAGGFTLAASFSGAVGTLAGVAGISTAAATAIAAGAIALDAAMLAGAIMPKPSTGGAQTKWKADPYAGLPYAMGRTLTSGNIVYRKGHGTNNNLNTFVTILSLGTILAFEAAFADKAPITFDVGGNAINGTDSLGNPVKFHNQIYEKRQLGACPEAAALAPPHGTPPGWTSAHKLSGLAATINTYVYDATNDGGLTYIPQPAWIINGVLVYDPRLDSTYPGGSGACRFGVESTYVYSENPHLHALTWAIGRFQNGQRVAGLGWRSDQIDIASFVEGANLDDARGWKVGGIVYTRPDTPWNTMKAILQAGGAQPAIIGGKCYAMNRAPRVSLATIGPADIVGSCSFAATQPRRSRINGIIPQYRSEAHDWEMVSAEAVSVADYVTLDGGERTREIAYPLVQDVDQVAQLAAYDICDAREAGPGSIPLKPWWLNFRPGDCLTFAPQAGVSMKVIIDRRALDPQTTIVTLSVRGETDGKHAFALGQTGTAPPIATLTGDDSNAIAAPTGDWALAGTVLSAGGATVPALVLTGASTNPSAEAIVIEYRVHASGLGDDENWIGASTEASTLARKEITSVTSGTAYDVSVRYRVRGALGSRAIFGPATVGSLSIASGAMGWKTVSPAAPTSTPTGSAGASEIDIAAASGVTTTGVSMSTPADSVTGLSASTVYGVFWNTGTSGFELEAYPAETRMADPAMLFFNWQATSDGADVYPSGGGGGGFGGGGSGYNPVNSV